MNAESTAKALGYLQVIATECNLSKDLRERLKARLVAGDLAVTAGLLSFAETKDAADCLETLQMALRSPSRVSDATPMESLSRDMSGRSQRSYPGDSGVSTVFFAPEMRKVAEDAVAQSQGHLVLGEINWARFDTTNGWPNLFIPNASDLQFHDVMFICCFHSPLVVFEQLSALYALARYGARSLKIVVPFFPTGTMERIDRVGEVATAATLASILSIVPHCLSGPAQLVFFDIHALQEQFYFTDNVIVQLKNCTHLLKQRLREIQAKTYEKVVICFPDDGAYKRFHTNFPGFEIVVCQKIRQGKERIVSIRDGKEFLTKGVHVIIVDDLVKSGGTLIECAKVILTEGASFVSCYVTHAVFPNGEWTRFWHKSDPVVKFSNFWITDSVPPVAEQAKQHTPFEVLSVATLIPYLRRDYWADFKAFD